MSDSPSFIVHFCDVIKIKAPILFACNDPASLAYGWDICPSLRLQNKPAELVYMRSGGHVISKPLQRFVSQEMNADWFDFWLNDHEDPDLSKAEQYKRWHGLKTLCGS